MKRTLWKRAVSGVLAFLIGTSNIGCATVFSSMESAISAAAVEMDTEAAFPGDENLMAASEPAPMQYFKISGDIHFNDEEWKELLRPDIFNGKITVKQIYEINGESVSVECETQNMSADDPFRLYFRHDGDGAGSFEISNVPESVIINGELIPVQKYEIGVSFDALPYYEVSNSFTVNVDNQSQEVSTLQVEVITAALQISPEIQPQSDTVNKSFETQVLLTNPLVSNRNNLKDPVKVNAIVGEDNTVLLPVGLQFDIKQKEDSDYRFDGNYRYYVNDSTEPAGEYFQKEIRENDTIKVVTTNYAQNQTVGFDVKWIDNNSTSRPKSDTVKTYFRIEYKTSDGEFKEITAEDLDKLGISSIPDASFVGSAEKSEQYNFSGLPFADTDGNEITYRIAPNDNLPDTYILQESVDDAGKQVFTFIEKTDYHASVVWNDESAQGTRPDVEAFRNTLIFYRRAGNGELQPVEGDFTIEPSVSSENVWEIYTDGLPRYDENNNEYDYVIIQNPEMPIKNGDDIYKTYYDNGSGSYGNDIEYCHDGGKITEVLKSDTEFSAEKRWYDDGTLSERPNSVVTLWRYVKDDTITGIDDAYEKGKVAQVVFQTANSGSSDDDKILSYDIGNVDTGIDFIENVADLPDGYKLQKYDDSGREYVYFVRETLSGENADNYAIKYQDMGGGEYVYGAPTDGVIRNVRREKAAISVEKIWKDPTGFSNIDGAKIQLEITDADGKPLEVYSSEDRSYEILSGDEKNTAQTIEGFTATIPSAETIYYVNIYDEEGKPINMDTVVFSEQIKEKDSSDWKAAENGIITAGDKSYKIETKLKNIGDGSNMIELGDGTKMYRYTQTNTLYAEREYKIIKTWASSIYPDDEYKDVKYINFTLERCTIRDMIEKGSDALFSTVDTVKVANPDQAILTSEENIKKELRPSGKPAPLASEWELLIDKLPKYDDEGYEYYYRAKEYSFIIEGSTSSEDDDIEMLVGTANVERRWSTLYHRNSDQTNTVNYEGTDGGGFFTISKIWQDNGDEAAHKDIILNVYKRSDLVDALNTLLEESGSDASDTVDLSKIAYRKQLTLTDSKNYSSEFSYGSGEKSEQFIVVEYKIGDAPVAYTYDALIYAATVQTDENGKDITHYAYEGKANVQNPNRKYKVETVRQTGGDVFILNTRTGETHIQVKKTWNDEQNMTNHRPSEIQFQLYKNGEVYSGVSGDAEIKTNTADIDVTLDVPSGIVTLKSKQPDNTLNQWEFMIENLPKFSESGEICFYNIEEVVQTNTGTSSVCYLQKKASPVVTSNGDIQTFEFNFTNVISGETRKVAFKYWQDSGIPDKESRPDLYFQLYRYLKSEGIETAKPCNDYKAQVWYNEEEAIAANLARFGESGFDWEIVIDDLPRFDESGREYGYYFKETMNNNGETVYGTYVQQDKETKIVDETEYEVFKNTITGKMSVKGKKTWTGLTGYNVETGDYLPEPKILLYRTTDSSVKLLYKSEDIQKFIQENGLVAISETELQVGKREYIFSESLPKFDPEGKRYYYFVKEQFDEAILDLLYSKTNANGTLTNTFKRDANRRQITVIKLWNNRYLDDTAGEKKYPSVTFELYRYEDGSASDTAKLISEYTFPSSAFDTDGNASYVFDDLLIYSPKGIKYQYYLKEKKINGYSETPIIMVSELGTDSLLKSMEENNEDVEVKNHYTGEKPIKLSGEKIWNDYGNAEQLRPDIVVRLFRHTKNEADQKNAVEKLEVKLLESDNENNEPYIEWNYGSEKSTSDKWTYTIYNLERYAQNGMPYIYTLREDAVTEYNNGKETEDSISVENTTYRSFKLKNSFNGIHYVRKDWDDGDNKYNLRPTSVTVKLQRSSDGGITYTDVVCPTGYVTGENFLDDTDISTLPSVLTIDGKRIVSIQLSTDHEKKNTNGNTWEYTFRNLPTANNAGQEYIYRCVEVAIGNVEIKTTDAGEQKAGSYFCESYSSGNKTEIKNTLDKTSLVVTKNWNEFGEDLYQARPSEIKFKLEKCGYGIKEGIDYTIPWETVQDKKGNDYIYTLSSKNNWTLTLENLPVVIVKENAVIYTLHYRAVEVTQEADGEICPVGALNYREVTQYTDNSSTTADHYYDAETARNYTKLKNELIVDDAYKTITVNKQWYRVTNTEKKAVFELLYSTDNENWYCYANGKQVENFAKHTVTDGCLTNVHTATTPDASSMGEIKWDNLPKYNREGKELYYKVIEHPVAGYATKVETNHEASSKYATEYTFTNIELQDYTVSKIWKNAEYAHKNGNIFTATFVLQKQEGSGDWESVENSEITLTSSAANDSSKFHTWKNLPKYTTDGKEITYRAVETQINGTNVDENGTNGDYVITYQYGSGETEAAFCNTKTTATNRMVYGFVNLSKAAAYLAPGVTPSGTQNIYLNGVKFNILDADDNIYVSNVETDENGNLKRNTDGTYGKEGKYLITGSYTLVEVPTNQDYSVWKNGIKFTVGVNGGIKDTGEHGTAWIRTDTNTEGSASNLVLAVEYHPSADSHSFEDDCQPLASDGNPHAYNIESRGVIQFTKTDETTELDTHQNAAGESVAYFGVYTDKECTVQVAGMMASDKQHFVLTDRTKEGNAAIVEQSNQAEIPYLREYSNGFSLLSGKYYLKELVAPPGYKLDESIRIAEIGKVKVIVTETGTDLSDVYSSNVAEIRKLNDSSAASADYKWTNIPNKVTLYKRDQYGRKVQLKNNGYLELKVSSGTFPTGEDTIRLYQNSETPSTKTDGTTPAGYVSYNANTGVWTITGLFDIDRSYTLREPIASVPDDCIQAAAVSFTVNADGTMLTSDAVEKEYPVNSIGNDYQNYYKPDADNNILVMRDVSRYLNDVGIKKVIENTNTPIKNISFKLYKVGSDGKGTVILKNKDDNTDAILTTVNLFTTDGDGLIQLSKLDDNIINLDTGKSAKYGLDIGSYYFEELERGASDQYRILGKVYFDILRADPENAEADYMSYATVTFRNEDGTAYAQNSDVGIIPNEPVTKYPKIIDLTKTGENGTEKLKGAKFTLSYVSINNCKDAYGILAEGYKPDETIYCITGSDGKLWLADENWNLKHDASNQPIPVDISSKGSYTLTETEAPALYMTPTHQKLIITFKVDSNNKITDVTVISGEALVTSKQISSNEGEHLSLDLTIKNQETIVHIAKLNDIVNHIKSKDQKNLNGEALEGAVLEIYEGTEITGIPVYTLDNDTTWTVKKLKENTVYTLHEKTAPVGYMEAEVIYFKLYGTNSANESNVSVWKGAAAPDINGADWSATDNLQNNVLTMVDEAVIAPVNMQKVLKNVQEPQYTKLQGAEFAVKNNDTDVQIGIAVSDTNGWLVWKEEPAKNGIVYNANGKRVTDSDTVKGTAIILQQNQKGYTFTEISAPDRAYNNGDEWVVKITSQNYKDYKTSGGYATDKYIDIFAANGTENKAVDSLTSKSSTADPTANDLVNPEYKSTVTLHKYDADEEADKRAIAGTEFTLYRGSVSNANIYKKAYTENTLNSSGIFKTNENGDLSIEIREKGNYILCETKASTGYVLDDVKFSFTLQDKSTEADNAECKFGYGENNSLNQTEDGIPNTRQKGEVTLLKTDKDTNAPLDGVVYTLTRTDTPKKSDNSNFDAYLLKEACDVTTGKAYVVSGHTLVESGTASAGTIHITGLNWGEYTLTEKTENSGYKLDIDSTYSFCITNTDLASYHLTIENDKIKTGDKRTNDKNQVTFRKTNMVESGIFTDADIKGLSGAVFEVHEGDCSNYTPVQFYASPDATEKISRITSGTDGKVTIYGLPTNNLSNTPKTYHLHEVTAPKGYKLQTEDVVFTIDRQGVVQVQAVNAEAVNAEEVIMQDEAIKIYLQKLGENDDALKGAEFELKDADGDKLANGTDSEFIRIQSDDGKTMIPVERVIGGHNYTLTEKKAPDGYECTAVIQFHVNADGSANLLKAEGGFTPEGQQYCASVTEGSDPTISIRNEKIRAKFVKVDASDASKMLAGVTLTLEPCAGYGFAASDAASVRTFTTNENGEISIPEGLLIHDSDYWLKETEAVTGYYIYWELKDGIKLHVEKDGSIKVLHNSDKYKSESPVEADNNNSTVILTVKNIKSATFDLTKKVDGNMGDLSGVFHIKMNVYENENDIETIASKAVDLKLYELYDSEYGKQITDTAGNIVFDNQNNFGNDAIPVGSILEIIEDNAMDYDAVVYTVAEDGTKTRVGTTGSKGTVRVRLNANEKIHFELVNRKNAVIDIGVSVKEKPLIFIVALMIPAAWLYGRFRRKRREEVSL